MTKDAERVAEKLRAAYAGGSDQGSAVLHALYSDRVEIHHNNPLPTDGPLDASLVTEVAAIESAAIRRALPDLEKIDITTDGSQVQVQTTIGGTVKDGRRLRTILTMLLEVRDGWIVDVKVGVDGDHGTGDGLGGALAELMASDDPTIPSRVRQYWAAQRNLAP